MHLHALDTYLPGDSLVHRLDPRVKLVLTVLFILTAALIPDRAWLFFGLLEGLILAAVLVSRVGMGIVQKRSALALPFLLAAVTVIFARPGEDALPLPGTLWAISEAGLWRFLSIVARSYLSIQAAVLLAATTPFPDLLWGMRALRVPRVLVAVGGFLYRYLFVLADEARRMLQAREARSAAPEGRKGGGTLIWRARVTGAMAGTLFLRAYERSERIWAAMVVRGYDGEVRVLSAPLLRPVDWHVGVGAGLLLLLLMVVARVL
ncbi:MAG: cobalt ECF transporter T component CbiQ [Anaerolineae bacterium]|nr:cobalt ECF transporter T component CbiQ [Anaerolineae bacterium]MCX8066992.1 cobalt ECF transporter T component CbiQ [Anaerolineae bacterium]MDW7991280.1 cobalt ECF transporter T component CbiQ [Anaerolineae bacterium]